MSEIHPIGTPITLTIDYSTATWLAEFAEAELVDDVLYRLGKQIRSIIGTDEQFYAAFEAEKGDSSE